MKQSEKTTENTNSLPKTFRVPLVLLTEDEVIMLLRIPQVTKAKDHHNVIENLRRMHSLPCIHICKTPLYPLEAVKQWIEEKAKKEQS